MLTLPETKKTERKLDTPEAIVKHVAAEYRRIKKALPFKAGDRVRILRRDGIPSQFMVGDVGVVLHCQGEFSPHTILLGVSDTGMTIHYPVQTANLEKLA